MNSGVFQPDIFQYFKTACHPRAGGISITKKANVFNGDPRIREDDKNREFTRCLALLSTINIFIRKNKKTLENAGKNNIMLRIMILIN